MGFNDRGKMFSPELNLQNSMDSGMVKKVETSMNFKGLFSYEIIEDDKVISKFGPIPNKIASGASLLVAQLLSSYAKNFIISPAGNTATVYSYFGITQFSLFEINNISNTKASGNCNNQMLNGIFNCYDTFNPTYYSDINTNNFPCLKTNGSILSEIDVTETSSSTIFSSDEKVMSMTSLTSGSGTVLNLTIQIPTNSINSNTPKFYSLAALMGTGTDPSQKKTQYVYAVEQFPVMTLTDSVSFKFYWSLYF